MADIINAENLPLVITAIGGALAGILVRRQGSRLGAQAKRTDPPPPDTVVAGGLVMSNVGSSDMIAALRDIAKALREATDEARAYRSSKTESLLGRIEDKLQELEDAESKRRMR